MINLNDVSTCIGLIGAPVGVGALLDAFVKLESKQGLLGRLETLSQMMSRAWVIYCVGFLSSMATGLACIHVAGFTHKIDGLGGWWTALQSAAPIALFLLFKMFIVDPFFFWGSGRLYAVLKGRDVTGRVIPRFPRWLIMGLLLLGACLATQMILTGAEAAQEAGLRKMMATPESAGEHVPVPSRGGDSVAGAGVTPDAAVPEVPPKKSFSIQDVLTSFSLVIADFYAHAFLILNGVACFMALLGFVRVAKWCASHIDMPVVPKLLFTAIAVAASACIALLLMGYNYVESL